MSRGAQNIARFRATRVESRYASVALRARGVGAGQVRWMLDGKPHPADQWA
jgi:hypothetical protein